ncbi:MAG: transposase [Nitrospirales bacterium]
MKPLYGGIDLHANNSVLVVLDDEDQVVYRKRFPNDLEHILIQLAPYRTQLQGLVVESTFNWYWLVDGLMEAGYHVHLANTAAIQQYTGLKYTDDDTDARWLAHLLRLGVLPTGYIYPKEVRAVRDLLRKRSQLVHQKTANLLSIQPLLTRNTGQVFSGNQIKQLLPETIGELVALPEHVVALQATLAVMRHLAEQITLIERAVEKIKRGQIFG